MASYGKEREHFFQAFGREFPRASTEVARKLLREATAEQRYNEIVCSIDVGERELARLEKKSEAREKRVRKLAESIGSSLMTNGDPRGFPFLIACPSGRTYDWGERGLGIPGKGLPASAFR